jgi:archaellum biogenesis ATPase FlaH
MSLKSDLMNMEIAEKIDAAIKNGAEIILVIVEAKKYVRTSLEILRYLTKDAEGVFVTLNRPYSSMKKLLEKEGVDYSRIIFIDSITRQLGGEEIDIERCIYLNSPDPTLIQMAIEQTMDRIFSENRFIYIDSLSTISLYKSFETLLKFIRYITGKIRIKGFIGTIFSVEKEINESYYSQIALMVDEVIEVD